jgi:hypothetical protein
LTNPSKLKTDKPTPYEGGAESHGSLILSWNLRVSRAIAEAKVILSVCGMVLPKKVSKAGVRL